MPKGFLVKRSKKAGPVSYKVRGEEEPFQAPCLLGAPALRIPQLHYSLVERSPALLGYYGGLAESFCPPSLSPTRPDSEEYPSPDSDQTRRTSSPALGGFAFNGSPLSPSLPETTTQPDSPTKPPASSSSKVPQVSSSKKRKSSGSHPQGKRRDEVTTSPILGLRIKDAPEEDSRPSSISGGVPLGEFICQLCKEHYSDPLSLAHHKCSRIVSVQYRCEECDKAFSCPANLASHRRWHKPKTGTEGRSSPSSGGDGPALSPQQPADSGSEEEEPAFGCPQCGKKFRRHAYLRKHLALHSRKAVAMKESGKGAAEPTTQFGGMSIKSAGLTGHSNTQQPADSRRFVLVTPSL